MTFKLRFHQDALQEWHKIDKTVREQFKQKLNEPPQMPGADSVLVSGRGNLYKIKLRTFGFRLIYQLQDKYITVLALTVGSQNCNIAYNSHLR